MFGISSAPELYQRTIQQVLEGCEGAYNIHDDIIIHARSVKEPDVRLRKTFERIQEKGLTLNRDKGAFSLSRLTFMGYLLEQSLMQESLKMQKRYDVFFFGISEL